MKNLIIASTSTIYNGLYLEYLQEEIEHFYKNASEILFIPYARPSGISHDDYTFKVQEIFNKIDKKVVGLHTFAAPEKAIENAQAIFTGGGNTFLLVSELYKHKIMLPLEKVLKNGIPYLGTSAGSNICGLTMQTTNDMPIVYPPSFKTLAMVPFNINPHYLDADSSSTHMGETRETRIKEFHKFNTQPVIGLREGSWLRVKDNKIILKGNLTARWFTASKEPIEVETESNLLEYI